MTSVFLLPGNQYTKSEFKLHAAADPAFAATFMTEWAGYAVQLSKQLGIRGQHLAKPVGMDIDEKMIDMFNEEQLLQLYELYKETKGSQDTR